MKWEKVCGVNSDEEMPMEILNNGKTARRIKSNGSQPRVFADRPLSENADRIIAVRIDNLPGVEKNLCFGIAPVQSKNNGNLKAFVGDPKDHSIGIRCFFVRGSQQVVKIVNHQGDEDHLPTTILAVGDKLSLHWHARDRMLAFSVNDQGKGKPINVPTGQYYIAMNLSHDARATLLQECAKRACGDEPEQLALKRLRTMWNDRSFSDAVVECGEHSWPCHRSVLASSSPVWARMLASPMKEGVTSKISIDESEPQVISSLLEFVYLGDCSLLRAESSKDKAPKMVKLLEHAMAYEIHELERILLTDILEVDTELVTQETLIKVARLVRSCKEGDKFLKALEELVKEQPLLLQTLLQNI